MKGSLFTRIVCGVFLAFLLVMVVGVVLEQFEEHNEAERAGCMMNQRKAVNIVTYMTNNGQLHVGGNLDPGLILREVSSFDCPSGGTYEWSVRVPDFKKGEFPVKCSHEGHQPVGLRQTPDGKWHWE